MAKAKSSKNFFKILRCGIEGGFYGCEILGFCALRVRFCGFVESKGNRRICEIMWNYGILKVFATFCLQKVESPLPLNPNLPSEVILWNLRLIL